MDLPGNNCNEIIFPVRSKFEILSASFYRCFIRFYSYYKDITRNISFSFLNGLEVNFHEICCGWGDRRFLLKKREIRRKYFCTFELEGTEKNKVLFMVPLVVSCEIVLKRRFNSIDNCVGNTYIFKITPIGVL